MTTREKAEEIRNQGGFCSGFGCEDEKAERKCPVIDICESGATEKEILIAAEQYLAEHPITIYDGYTCLIAEAEKLAAEFPDSSDMRDTVERLKETRAKLSPSVASAKIKDDEK